MPNRTFNSSIGEKIEKQYADVVRPMSGGSSRGGCMAAVYNGALTALYGEVYADTLWKSVYRESRKLEKAEMKKEGTYNTVDLIMEMLKKQGRAGETWEFRFKSKKWQCEKPKTYAGMGVEQAIVQSVKAAKHGWYFFGASVSGGYHSVVIGIDHQATSLKIYWLDQFSKGLSQRRNGYATSSTEVTRKLDQAITKVGTNHTKLWPLHVVLGLRDIAKGL